MPVGKGRGKREPLLRCDAPPTLQSELRFQAHDVRELVGEQVAEDGLEGGDGAEDEAADGEETRFPEAGDLPDVGAEAVVFGHVVEHAGFTHLFLAEADAQPVVLVVAVEEAEHEQPAGEAAPAREVEGEVEDFGDEEARVEEGEDARGGEDDDEVDGEKWASKRRW